MTTGKRERSRRENALRRLAARQHGLIHRDQALGAGMTDSSIHRRVRSGTWVRHYRCVYGVAGAPATFEQRGLAACLAIGKAAWLSHTSAGRMWGFYEGRLLEVTVRGSVTTEPPGVVVHRTTTLRAGDAGKLRGVPVTSPVRTLMALAALLPEDEMETVLQAAVLGGCVVADEIRARVAGRGHKGDRGRAVLRRLLPACPRQSHVETPLERLVAQALLGDGLPPACREHPVYVGGRVYYVDFAFPDGQVAVEADGRRWHSDPISFERDRQRQNALTAAGWRVLRVTNGQMRSGVDGLRAAVRELVAATPGKREQDRRA